MFDIEKININFAFGSVFFFIAVVLLTLYSIYIYRHTVPEVSAAKKTLLILLRTAALLLLLFFLFEPVLTISKKEYNRPVNLVLLDNSRSININDGTSREQSMRNFLSALEQNQLADNTVFYTFGSNLNRVDFDSISFAFNEGITNLSKAFNSAEESDLNISSLVVVSDGVITEGSNPVYQAAELNIPVFTLGLGDSARKNDIRIGDVLYNEYIYSGVSTIISASVINTGFSGRTAAVSLSENGRNLIQQDITFTDNEYQELKFKYKPDTPGEKKLSLSVSEIEGEQSFDNNRKVFYVNVLSSKIKVLLIAGAPSPDLSFIRNTLSLDENLSVSSITQIASGKYLESNNKELAVDTADILFLIGFPGTQSEESFLKKIFDAITINKKPYFLVLSDGSDLNKLKRYQNELPFSIGRVTEGYTEALAYLNPTENRNPLVYSGSSNTISEWNGLPPVFMVNSDLSAKPESDILATVIIRNIPVKKPLILTRKIGSRKSVAFLGKDIWRWKLQTATKAVSVYDNFIQNSVKWLNTGEDQKQVVVRTSKKLYSLGEEIPFIAQVYDAAFNPIPDAKVEVNIRSGEEKSELTLNPLGNGLYDGTFHTNKTGDYSFSGSASVDENKIGSDNGSFNIGEVDIEMLNPRMDYEMLSLLASETKGKFFMPEQQEELISILKQRVERTSDVKIVTSEFSLWSNEWLLIFVVLFLAAEWFIRKQSGML